MTRYVKNKSRVMPKTHLDSLIFGSILDENIKLISDLYTDKWNFEGQRTYPVPSVVIGVLFDILKRQGCIKKIQLTLEDGRECLLALE